MRLTLVKLSLESTMTNHSPHKPDVSLLVSEYRDGQVGRRDFLRRVVAAGLSSAAAYTLLDSANQASAQNFTTHALGEEGSPAQPPMTTQAVGEETTTPSPNPPTATTRAIGEESGPPATTRRLGEEEKPPTATTWSQGEESTTPPKYTTFAVGEESSVPPATTQAVGEESSPPATTFAVGEEERPKCVTPPPATTQAFGEEGNVTTQAVGEEGRPTTSPRDRLTTFAVGEESSSPSRRQNRPSVIPQLPNVWRNWNRW